MKTKSQIFQSKFPEFIGNVEISISDKHGDVREIITYINIPGNYVGFTYYFTAECGCCIDSDKDSDDLTFLDDISDELFNELCNDVAKQL